MTYTYLEALAITAREAKATDFILEPGKLPRMRVNGELKTMGVFDPHEHSPIREEIAHCLGETRPVPDGVRSIRFTVGILKCHGVAIFSEEGKGSAIVVRLMPSVR